MIMTSKKNAYWLHYLRCQILKKYLEKILFLNCEDYYAKKLDIISGMN